MSISFLTFRFADRYGFYDLYDKDEESLENLADHLNAMSSYKKVAIFFV